MGKKLGNTSLLHNAHCLGTWVWKWKLPNHWLGPPKRFHFLQLDFATFCPLPGPIFFSVPQQEFTSLVLVQRALVPYFCSIVVEKNKQSKGSVYASLIFLLSFCALFVYTHPRTTWPEIIATGTVRNWNTSTQAVLNFLFTKLRWAQATDLLGMSPSIWNETLPATSKHRSTVALVNRREALIGEGDQLNNFPKIEFYRQFGELSNLRWLRPWGMKASQVCEMRDCRNLQG